jgi:hypothetical protein
MLPNQAAAFGECMNSGRKMSRGALCDEEREVVARCDDSSAGFWTRTSSRFLGLRKWSHAASHCESLMTRPLDVVVLMWAHR